MHIMCAHKQCVNRLALKRLMCDAESIIQRGVQVRAVVGLVGPLTDNQVRFLPRHLRDLNPSNRRDQGQAENAAFPAILATFKI